MKESEKKRVLDKVLQYGMKMAQGKYVSAQRVYSDISRSLKTDREEFFEKMEE